MRCSYKIDFKKRVNPIEYKTIVCSINRLRPNTGILFYRYCNFLTKKISKRIYIKEFDYKIIPVPYYVDKNLVILQNDFLPIDGQYFLI